MTARTVGDDNEVEDRSFTVVIRSTGESFEVPVDSTILEVLERAGMFVPFSCRQGLCATCKTKVVAGIPDHRDFVLSDEQRASGAVISICVSRSLSPVLELGL